MRTREIGRTGVRVTELGFGAAPIGNLYREVDHDTAMAAVGTAWCGGVRYFDTAPHYGLGLSETRLGQALRDRPRDSFALSTKVGRLLVDNDAPSGSDLGAGGFAVPDTLRRERDYSRDGVRRSLESSLRRLDTSRIDIVYVHDPEDFMDVAVSQAVPALLELKDQGVVGAVGVGMNLVAPLRRFVAETPIDVVMVAGRWTLADRTAEPLLDDCLAKGVALVSAAPFNSGLLASAQPAAGVYFDYGPAPAEMLTAARRLAETAARYGVSLPHAALQFPLTHPAVVSVVAGLGTAEHARTATEWATTSVAEDLWPDADTTVGLRR
ncbi:aldo/keto reductase [Angustibacter sp. McL0619]|uniref:aldo/keto reductase n=1 Tax=Angustibacter sp. McL0619 TaxID=3415676 RepID=UPI003CEFEA18